MFTFDRIRVPLWEKAAAEMEKHADSDESGGAAKQPSSAASAWWAKEWVDEINGDLGKHPLLCVVQSTFAEFPPDPKVKVVRKDKDGDDTARVFWRGSADSNKTEYVRLAVTLRAVTPLRHSMSVPMDSSKPLPPMFTVVVFPSQQRPFLVPFAW